MPVIKVQDEIERLAVGTILEAVCTDRGVLHDIPAWCRINGHKVVDTREEDGEYRVVVEICE
jgi:tRNA 2-thiouridine synthesizing protein A